MRSDRGETLIELLIALSIIGISMIAIVGAMSTGIIVSDQHRRQAVAGAAVLGYAEAVKRYAETGLQYQASCSPSYPVAFTVPPGYTKSIVANTAAAPNNTTFWVGSAFQAACLASAETGIQRLIVQVASTDGRATERLVIVVRRSCAPGNSDPACA